MASQNPPYTNGQSHAGPSVSSLEPPHPSPALHRSSNGNGGSAEDDIPAHLYTRVPAHLLLPDGTPNYLRMILTARVYDIIQPTPLTKAVQLSGRLGVNVHFKREDLQPVFSFKCRGAYNCIAQLSAEEKQKGVVACSAGACCLPSGCLSLACEVDEQARVPPAAQSHEILTRAEEADGLCTLLQRCERCWQATTRRASRWHARS